jgi:hypothetical protein
LQIGRKSAANPARIWRKSNGNENAVLTTYGASAYSRHVKAYDNLADTRADQAVTSRRQAKGPKSRAIDSAIRGCWIEQGEKVEAEEKAG